MGRYRMLLGAIVIAAAAGCGSTSSSTVAGPTPVRCQLAATNSTPSFNASGGSGAVSIEAARECSWSGAAQAEWIVLVQPTSGQGDGSLGYRVQQNPAGIPRRGSINVGGVLVDVGQEAAPCTFQLGTQEIVAPVSGGTFDVPVQAPAGCGWTGSSGAPWIALTSGAQGTGSGRATVTIAANPGEARQGTVTIAGIAVRVTQRDASSPLDPTQPPLPPAPGDCQYEWSPAQVDFPSAGGDGLAALRTRPECTWEIGVDAAWVSLRAPASGRGSGDATVEFRVAASSDRDARTARMRVGAATLTITQSGTGDPSPPGGCTYAVEPTFAAVGVAGGEFTLAVATSGGCAWAAASNAPWIAVTAGAAGTGPGQVRYRVEANPSTSARTGTLSVAGQVVTIEQAGVVMLPVSVSGQVQNLSGACPSIVFRVESRDVQTSASTQFRRGSCNQLREGRSVTVSGLAPPGGAIQALEVRFTDE